MNSKKITITVIILALFLILFTANTYPQEDQNQEVQVQEDNQIKFPPRMNYTVTSNNQPMGHAVMFFRKSTGMIRFNRPLSSLRLTLYSQEKGTFHAMFEAYVFNDNHSLYKDTFLTAHNAISRIQRNEDSTTLDPGFQQFVYKGEADYRGTQFRLAGQYNTISQLSSMLVATRHVAMGKDPLGKQFHYLSSNTPSQQQVAQGTMLAYKGKETIRINGQKIPVTVMALLQTTTGKELHLFKIYNDPRGYCFPVVIIFNSSRKYSMQLTARELPIENATGKQDIIRVLYLDFMNTHTQDIQTSDEAGQLILQAVSRQMENNIESISIAGDKQLSIDSQNHTRFNHPQTIRTIQEIIWDQRIPSRQRKDTIFRRLAIPSSIDIIVTGLYSDDAGSSNINFRPIVIFKDNPDILTRNLLLKRDEIICSTSADKPILCQDGNDYVAHKIKRYFSPATNDADAQQSMSVEDAYRMIITKGFFCHSVDYGYHSEVLEKLSTSQNIDQLDSVTRIAAKRGTNLESSTHSYTFSAGRDVTTLIPTNRKFVVKTTSVNKKNIYDIISSYWAPLKVKSDTLPNAKSFIRKLNYIKYGGFSDWRLPTLEELLSISQHYKKGRNFIPFVPRDRDLKIWTSNLLDKRVRFTPCADNTWLAVNCVHQDNNHRLNFSTLCKNHTAYILPIRSSQTRSTQLQKRLFITNLTFMKPVEHTPMESGELARLLGKAVKIGMNLAAATKERLAVNEDSRRMFNTDDNANDLTNIFFDPNLPKEEKLARIVSDIMDRNHTSLMVTGLYIDDGKSKNVTIRPVVIDKNKKEIRVRNLQFDRNKLLCPDSTSTGSKLCQEVETQITRAVKELLELS